MSSAFGKASDYYPPVGIPRAKLARRDMEEYGGAYHGTDVSATRTSSYV